MMGQKAIFSGAFWGFTVYAFFVTLGFSFALAREVSFIYLSSYLKYTAMGSILFGGFLAGYFNGKRGWASGGLAGVSMGIALMLLSLLFLPGSPALGEISLTVFTTAFLGGMAGVCGVNVLRARRQKQKKTGWPKNKPLS